MKVTREFGKFSVEFDAATQVELFEQVSNFQEVFEQTKCGKCGSENLRFVVRTDAEENKYYELRCADCGARLSFGCNKKGGGLFPKRKDAEGNWKPDGGWCKWDQTLQKEV